MSEPMSAEVRLQRVLDVTKASNLYDEAENRVVPVADILAALNAEQPAPQQRMHVYQRAGGLGNLGDIEPAPEQPTHHTNDCDLLIRHRACSCGYAEVAYARTADL